MCRFVLCMFKANFIYPMKTTSHVILYSSEWLFVRARTNSFWAIRTAITHVILSYNSVLKYTNLRRVLWSRD